MRVMHLISGGDTGGAKTAVITLLKELQNEVDIELVCLSMGVFYTEAISEGITTTLFEQKSRFDFSVLQRLVHKLKEEKFDILHCHGARANFISGFLRKKIEIPIITTVHSDYRLDFDHQWYKKVIFTTLNKYSLKKMDYYLVLTNIMKDMFIELGFEQKKIYIIYNGIKILKEAKDYSILQNKKEIVFGCATRLMPIKGTDILLQAVKECVDKGYNIKLKIAGNGDIKYTQELEAYVKEHYLENNVTFLGFVKNMDAFYDSIHVNILPSYTEGFPYALLEGGVRGIATIASRAGGIVEMIEDKKSGRLFDVADYKALAVIMMDMLDGKEDIEGLGAGFRQKVINEFSDVAMSHRHKEIYSEIL